MTLEERYNSWQFNQGNRLGNNKTPREQTEGRVSVDFLPNTYQTEVRNRTPGNKIVTQASGDDQTNGTFRTSAFSYYRTLVASPLKTFKSKVVHLYNAQGTANQKFVTSAKIKNTPGALYSTNS